MDIIEAIKHRKSCRTYNQALLSAEDKNVLEASIKDNKGLIENADIKLIILEKKGSDKKLELNYGSIQGHNTYLLGTSVVSSGARINYGYLMEKIVLRATEIGISTCWIGYFDRNYFEEIVVNEGFEIPSIVILGYADHKPSVIEKLTRLSISASRRLEWGKIFFDYNSGLPLTAVQVKEYNDPLEMVRLAPSSGNTQPWRILFDEKTEEFHFFKKPVSKRYEERGLHDIDMGIAIAHFDMTAQYYQLAGKWIKHHVKDLKHMDDLQYVMTWQCSD